MNKECHQKSDIFIRRPYQVCLIVIVVLALYYPAIFAEVSMLDDQDAITGLFNLQSFDIGSLFFPRAQEGGYYRPFLGVSYLIDRFWWFLDPKIMHFENILMHLVNSVLVFFVGIRLCRNDLINSRYLPLAGSLLFALHPINTESVNWISGRTDPMACMFVLSALLLVLQFREKGKLLYLLAAFFLTLCGILAKETALGFILGAVFILTAEDERKVETCEGINRISPVIIVSYTALALLSALIYSNFYMVIVFGVGFWFHLAIADKKATFLTGYACKMLTLLAIITSGVAVVVLFYTLRKLAFASDTSKVAATLKAMAADFNYTLELFLGAAGFYVKKFFIPTPLNLAIREIDPLYALFGVICFMSSILLIYLRKTYSSLIIAGFMMLSPAFLLVFGTFAWTAYAERYCYIPSAFWILAGVSYIDKNIMTHTQRVIGRFLFAVVVVYFAVSSFQRNLLWLTNIDIIKDTVEKSPDFKNIRGLYMSALVNKKDFVEAERQYQAAQKIRVVAYDERYDIMYAAILTHLKRYPEAEGVYQDVEIKTKGHSTELYEAMISYFNGRILELKEGPDVDSFRRQRITAFEKLYRLNKSPLIGYRLGQNYLSIGKSVQACEAIKSAIVSFKSNEPLKRNAENLLKSIEKCE